RQRRAKQRSAADGPLLLPRGRQTRRERCHAREDGPQKSEKLRSALAVEPSRPGGRIVVLKSRERDAIEEVARRPHPQRRPARKPRPGRSAERARAERNERERLGKYGRDTPTHAGWDQAKIADCRTISLPLAARSRARDGKEKRDCRRNGAQKAAPCRRPF